MRVYVFVCACICIYIYIYIYTYHQFFCMSIYMLVITCDKSQHPNLHTEKQQARCGSWRGGECAWRAVRIIFGHCRCFVCVVWSTFLRMGGTYILFSFTRLVPFMINIIHLRINIIHLRTKQLALTSGNGRYMAVTPERALTSVPLPLVNGRYIKPLHFLPLASKMPECWSTRTGVTRGFGLN